MNNIDEIKTGYGGKPYDSKAEAEMSLKLAEFGIVQCQQTYPVTFADSDRAPFLARPDAVHTASGVWFELKSGRLCGLKTKATAAKAKARFHAAEAAGYINDANRAYKLHEASWNQSLHKQAAVQSALTPARMVILFKERPSEKEQKRLDRAGIFSRDMRNIGPFAFFLKLAALGLGVAFEAQGHSFALKHA